MYLRLKRLSFVTMLCCVLSSCALIDVKDDVVGTPEATADIYAKEKNSSGVVLLDVNWGRVWGCASYENAQLVTFSFDRMLSKERANTDPSDFVLTTPGLVTAKRSFESYAYLLPPGEYGLSYVKIKAAKSTSDVGYFVAGRDTLLKDGESNTGSFRVEAGEAVYIGSFALDCFKQPMIWRYYVEGQTAFKSRILDYGKKYPFLDLSKVTYRLFDTKIIGRPYELK